MREMKKIALHTYWNSHTSEFRTVTAPKAGEDMEHQELSFTVGGNAKWYSHFGRLFRYC